MTREEILNRGKVIAIAVLVAVLDTAAEGVRQIRRYCSTSSPLGPMWAGVLTVVLLFLAVIVLTAPVFSVGRLLLTPWYRFWLG